MTHTLFIGKHQLAVSLNRRRGRPKKTLITHTKGFIAYLLKIAKDKRFTGHPVSKVLRRIVENKKTQQLLGTNLVLFSLVASLAAPNISAFTSQPEAEINVLGASEVKLTTEKTARLPLESFSISQGYHFFHRAIDLNEITGAPIYPIMSGVVEETSRRLGYGNLVVIDHGSGFKSLYAHLSKIVVQPEEEVDKNTVIGTVGSTGFSTGPHLHLEIHDHGEPINPLTVLEAPEE